MKTMNKGKFTSVDEYLSGLPENKKKCLEILRKTIKQTAPKAEELISYNMPAFKLDGMLVYYAANKEHIGFYPTSSVLKAFKDELLSYETSKGTIKFPIDQKLPLGLIKKIVTYRIKENTARAKLKGKGK